MKATATILVFMVGLLLPSAVVARPTDCGSRPTTEEIASCLSTANARADMKLHAKYQEVSRLAITASMQAELKTSQKAWVRYEYATCEVMVSKLWRDGTARYTEPGFCKLRLTLQRTQDLDKIFFLPLHR